MHFAAGFESNGPEAVSFNSYSQFAPSGSFSVRASSIGEMNDALCLSATKTVWRIEAAFRLTYGDRKSPTTRLQSSPS